MNDIKTLLRSWGSWARQDGSNDLGYGEPMSAVMRQAPERCPDDVTVGSKRYDNAEFMSDEEALIMDRIVGRLLHVHPIEGQCLRLRYVSGRTVEEIGYGYLSSIEGKKVGKLKAAQYVATAEGFVSGFIDNL